MYYYIAGKSLVLVFVLPFTLFFFLGSILFKLKLANVHSFDIRKTTMASGITAFMNQVAGLVQLVDSRDIMELELKQYNCEVIIREKEALLQPPAGPMVMMQSPQPQASYVSITTTSTTVCTRFFSASSFCICTRTTLTYPCKTKVLSSSNEMPHGWKHSFVCFNFCYEYITFYYDYNKYT
ncbi:hypothetical protein Hanom_Chr14g01335601 [Helianthus anomalus]